MSYIHQALKKAQTERDDRYGKYEGILLSSRSKKSGHFGRWVLIGASARGILSLAFISYSWLDLTGPRSTTANPSRPMQAAPVSAPEKAPDAEALYEVGKSHHRSGRLSEAKIFYEKALRVDPACVAALNNLGVILMAEKNYAAARSRFEKAMRLKPGYVDPCYNLACLFALTDQPEQGLRYLKRAVSLHPQVKAWALEDADLKKLRHQPGFAETVDR
jgi:tetratricopeptide (TPR) repeat protein